MVISVRAAFLLALALVFAAGCGAPHSPETPLVVRAVAPSSYPEIAVESRVEGRVTVEVSVNRPGEVTLARVVDLEGPAAIFRPEAYARVARQWRFDSSERAPEVRTARLQFVFRIMPPGTAAEKLGTTFVPPYTVEMRAEEPGR